MVVIEIGHQHIGNNREVLLSLTQFILAPASIHLSPLTRLTPTSVATLDSNEAHAGCSQTCLVGVKSRSGWTLDDGNAAKHLEEDLPCLYCLRPRNSQCFSAERVSEAQVGI